ncbi:MAG: flavin monoamine oxidase family protein, partial [Planctomycetaceae bacterium]
MRRVLIVGAGFAGLACAYELSKSGCEVRVLEARGRLGGRVDSRADLISGKVVEAGGELLGANHPMVIRYASEFGLRFLDVEEPKAMRSRPVVLNGHKLTDSELAEVDAQSEIVFTSLTEMARGVDLARPWETPDAESLDRVSLASWLAGIDISARAKLMVEAYFTSNNSVSIARQSLLGNLTQIRGGGLSRYWTDTESYRCQGGNQQFATKLAEAIGAQHIQLNCPVTDIHVSRDQVLVTAGSSTQYAVDDVVLAVPPSTWSQIRINPLLPAALLPQMGTALKCLSTVRGRFWEQTGLPP